MNDDDWFDALAGRDARGVGPEGREGREGRATGSAAGGPAASDIDGHAVARLEARLMRAAIRHAAALADEPPLSAAQLAAVAPRRPGWCAGCTRRWQRLRRWLAARPRWAPPALAGLAVALAALLVGPWRLPAPVEGGPVLRGGPRQANGVWLLASPQPAAARDALADGLAAHGAHITRYERLGRFGLQARWTGPLPEAARAELAQLGIGPSPAQEVDVEFAAPAP